MDDKQPVGKQSEIQEKLIEALREIINYPNNFNISDYGSSHIEEDPED